MTGIHALDGGEVLCVLLDQVGELEEQPAAI
jgi:hypothetical protein